MNIMFHKVIIAIMLVLLTSTVISQNGPELPCPDCNGMDYKPLPKSGNWFNPEQSGVGFNIEIQNTTILGFYYGYTEAGDSMWAMFSGKLEKVEDADSLWSISTELVEASGGQCINCDYQFYTDLEKIGDIDITFNRLGHANYRINDGEYQNIIPMYFGYNIVQSVYNGTDSNIVVPELEGWWMAYRVQFDGSDWPKYYQSRYVTYHISRAQPAPPSAESFDVWFTITIYSSPLDSISDAPIRCNFSGDNMTYFNHCWLDYADGEGGRIVYNIPWSNITEDRIFGVADDGSTIEFLRLELDECPLAETANCINTNTLID